MEKILKQVYRVELGAIEDAIKERQKEATDLKQRLNSSAAAARDLFASVERAELKYKQAQGFFDDYKRLEKEYNSELDFADKMYISVKKGFELDNELSSINEELKKYNSEIKPFDSNVKDLFKANEKWKNISKSFKKIN
jgi:chromosome segregation ATPase